MTIGVLGATGPAGRGLASRLASVGHEVIAGSREESRAEAVVSELRDEWGPRVDSLSAGTNARAASADLVVVLGGDGTVLRALARFLGTGIPVVGVNFGRVGFLSSMGRRELEEGLGRVFAGEYDVVELPTLELELPSARSVAVNDVVVSSASLGRMIELELAVGGEELGRQPCDGIICSTPSGSTAYNLSNGGPVLMWGLEAIALTYVAAHSLHARPLVIPPGSDVIVWNRSGDVEAGVLVDGHQVGTLAKAERAVVRIAAERSLLATLPEATFVRRYRQSFAS